MLTHDIAEACEETVATLLAEQGWRLLDPGEWASRTSVALHRGLATEPRRAALHVYSLALYEACSGSEGAERQEIGYEELGRYLFGIAFYRYGEMAEDATQQALVRVYENFAHCRVPGAFLAWAIQQLRDAARALRPAIHVAPVASLDAAFPIQVGELPIFTPLPADPAERVVQKEQQHRVQGLVTEFLQRHPRAQQQLAALLLKHFWEMDDEAISLRLQKSVGSVYVLRTRAKRKLQQNAKWRDLAREMGLL